MGGSRRTTWPVVLLWAVAVEGFAQQPAARLVQAERLYAQAIALQQAGHPGCVDAFYAAGSECWSALHESAAVAPRQPLNPRVWTIYHDSLAELIEQGQRHGRLDPRSHLTVHTASGTSTIPIRFIGFAWRPEDFHQLAVVRDYRPQRPRTVHRRDGRFGRRHHGSAGRRFDGNPASTSERPVSSRIIDEPAGAVLPGTSSARQDSAGVYSWPAVRIQHLGQSGQRSASDTAGDRTIPEHVLSRRGKRVSHQHRPAGSHQPAAGRDAAIACESERAVTLGDRARIGAVVETTLGETRDMNGIRSTVNILCTPPLILQPILHSFQVADSHCRCRSPSRRPACSVAARRRRTRPAERSGRPPVCRHCTP
jgi:hypothetical protein